MVVKTIVTLTRQAAASHHLVVERTQVMDGRPERVDLDEHLAPQVHQSCEEEEERKKNNECWW